MFIIGELLHLESSTGKVWVRTNAFVKLKGTCGFFETSFLTAGKGKLTTWVCCESHSKQWSPLLAGDRKRMAFPHCYIRQNDGL